jgi:AcrR family transcriptional regulator
MSGARKNTKSNGRKNSLGREDWLNAALESLNERGIDAVKVLPLSHKLGVTRGSFYWHFEDREDLLRQMLEFWERELTDEVIVSANALDASSREKLRYVIHNVLFYRQSRYDTAISAWGMFDEQVAQAMKRVLRKRMRFVGRLLEKSGLDKVDAALRARFLIGFMLVDVNTLPRETTKQKMETVERCIDFLFQQPAGKEPLGQ